MKELSIEEKAKRYDEAIERAKEINNEQRAQPFNVMTRVFPELKESEDEKIRKQLLKHLREAASGKSLELSTTDYERWATWVAKQGGITKLSDEEQNKFAKGVLTSCALSFIDYLDAHKYEDKMCVSNGECEDIENAFHNAMWDRLHRYYCKYIEKQGEQKSAWSEEDECFINRIITKIEIDIRNWEGHGKTMIDSDKELISWLKSLKDRVQPQPKQEWSKEDILMLDMAIASCEQYGNTNAAKWLNSIRPQSNTYHKGFEQGFKKARNMGYGHWKPSDEQIEALESATKNCAYSEYQDCLRELIGQLKKLREE